VEAQARGVTRRGEVWICPRGYVPPGRLTDPESTDLWVSWQDEGLRQALEDDAVLGVPAAVEWGRKRAEVVMIRLGHHEGSYFSAGDRHPADAEGVPHWPPAAPPPEGWWIPPPAPTAEDVSAIARRVEHGELSAADAAAWAHEREQIFVAGGELDVPTHRALVELQERVA
jgi:hypothetical protein